MNPRYQAYLEDVAERKKRRLPPPPYVITPDGKMTFEQFRPGQDLGMVDPTHASGAVRLGAPGALYTPSQAEQTFVNQQRPSTDPNDYPANIPGTTDWMRNMTFDLRRDRRDREHSDYKQEQMAGRSPPIKKKTVITQETGQPTKKVTTETAEDAEGESLLQKFFGSDRTQQQIMEEQFADHAAKNTVDLPNIPFISDAEAEAQGMTAEQDESGIWWWIDTLGNRYRARRKAAAEQFPTNKWNLPYDPTDVGLPGHPFETTAEREERLRGEVAEAAWDQDEADQVGIANFIQAPAAAPTMPGWGDKNLRDPAVLAYRDKQRAEAEAAQAAEDRIWGLSLIHI